MRKYIDFVDDSRNGKAVSGASVKVVFASTGLAATIYSDNGSTTIANATVTTDADGMYQFWAPAGLYDLQISINGTLVKTLEDVAIDGGTDNAVTAVATVAALKALPTSALVDGQTIDVTSYYASSTPDGGGGKFKWDSASSASDNGGTILAPDAGGTGRWKRLHHEDVLHADWFGGDLDDAVAALPSTGGTIHLADKTYEPMSALTKAGVKLIGAKRPYFNSGGTGLENGTIIKGPLKYRANNLEFRDLGVDSGSTVVTALYAGTAQEGLSCNVNDLGASPQFTNLVVDNVVAIAKTASSSVHAFAAEGYTRATINNVETLFGTHGQAYKLLDSHVSNIKSRGNASEGVIIKSDATRQSKRTTFVNVKVGNYSADTLNGIDIQAQGGQEVSDIVIVNAVAEGIGTGLKITPDSGAGNVVRDVTFIGCKFNSNSVDGFSSSGDADAVRRIKFIGCEANTNTQFGFTDGAGARFISYTDSSASNNASGFVSFGQNVDIVGSTARDNTNYGFYAKTGASVYKLGLRGSGNGTALEGADANVHFFSRLMPDNKTAPTLLNSWADYGAGNTAAGYYIDNDGKVHLQGLVKNGVAGEIFTLPAGYRPPELVRFPVATNTGYGEVYVEADGSVVQGSGGTGYLSLDGIYFRTYN